MKGQDKKELIRLVRGEIATELSRMWKRPQYPKQLPKLGKMEIGLPSKDDSTDILNAPPPAESEDSMHAFEFENIPIYSHFEGKFVVTKDAVVKLESIDKGSTSSVYLAIHIYTLALIAVSSILLAMRQPQIHYKYHI